MKKMKQLLFGLMTAGLVVACTSENGIMPDEEIIPPVEDNRDWQKMDYELDVQQGEGALTRTIGDLDENDLPPAKYPSKCGIYLHTYDSGAGDYGSSVITLREPKGDDYIGSDDDNKISYYYCVDDTHSDTYPNGKVSFKRSLDGGDTEEVSVKIAEYSSEPWPLELFFFTSQPQIKEVPMPEVEDNWYPKLYPDATKEFGDKLFSSEGYFFGWKDEKHSKLGLFYIARNDYEATEIKEIREINNWTSTSLSVKMKRMTACVTIRMILVKRYTESGYVASIDEVEMDKFDEAITLTDKALQAYIDSVKNEPYFKEKYTIGDVATAMKTFSVANILVRKKVFKNFPSKFDWEKGLVTRDRFSCYVCDLNYPSWIDNVARYEHGSNIITGLTSTCTNEPFLPASGDGLPRITLDLFMGIGERNSTSGDIQGGTYKKLTIYSIPFDQSDSDAGYSVSPNTHTYIYVGITLENIIELYYHLFIGNLSGKEPATRSDNSDDIPCITLPSHQMIVTSEPYISEHTH